MTQEVLVTILVAKGFIPCEPALVQDVLRIASRLDQKLKFSSLVCSIDEEKLVEGQEGLRLRSKSFRVNDTHIPDHLIVLGGAGVRGSFKPLGARLHWIERMNRNLLLLSDAASAWQRLHQNTDHISTHGENQQLKRDAACAPDHDLPQFSQISRIITSADVVLNYIVAPLSKRLAQSVAHVFLMGRKRQGDPCQPRNIHSLCDLKEHIMHLSRFLRTHLAPL